MKNDSYNLKAKTDLIFMEACFLSKQKTKLENVNVLLCLFRKVYSGVSLCRYSVFPSVPLANWVVPKGAI